MEVLIKIIAAVINAVCLLITLVYPCEATMFSLLPVIVTSSTWIVDSVRKREMQLTKYTIILVTIAGIAGGICFFLGLTSNIVQNGSITYLYDIVFNSSVAFLGEQSFDYFIFACGICVVFGGITIPEICAYYKKSKNRLHENNRHHLSFDDIVESCIEVK